MRRVRDKLVKPVKRRNMVACPLQQVGLNNRITKLQAILSVETKENVLSKQTLHRHYDAAKLLKLVKCRLIKPVLFGFKFVLSAETTAFCVK